MGLLLLLLEVGVVQKCIWLANQRNIHLTGGGRGEGGGEGQSKRIQHTMS